MESKKEVYAMSQGQQGSFRAYATDQPSTSDATRHHYHVTHTPTPGGPEIDLATIKFQDGIPAQVGINGVTDESLLAILADHLDGFQQGPCNCEANRQAAWHVHEAQRWLKQRLNTQRGATSP